MKAHTDFAEKPYPVIEPIVLFQPVKDLARGIETSDQTNVSVNASDDILPRSCRHFWAVGADVDLIPSCAKALTRRADDLLPPVP